MQCNAKQALIIHVTVPYNGQKVCDCVGNKQENMHNKENQYLK